VTVLGIPEEAYAPRTEEERYRVYLRAGEDLSLLATAGTAGGIGQAILTNDEDARAAGYGALYDLGVLGLLDAVERRWIVLPWQGGGP